MPVRPFEYGSADYHAARDLRRRFLREPLGLELSEADVAGEDTQHHFGVYDAGGELLGAAIGKPDPDDASVVRLRQVVVHESRRGTGVGRELMAGAERLLAERGYTAAVLYARDDSAAFYERCGYERTGVTTELIGLPHHEMRKGLS